MECNCTSHRGGMCLMAVGGLPTGQPPTRKDHRRSEIASSRGLAAVRSAGPRLFEHPRPHCGSRRAGEKWVDFIGLVFTPKIHIRRSPSCSSVSWPCWPSVSRRIPLLAADDDGPVYLTPAEAGPDYLVQGEYLGDVEAENGRGPWGAQVVALGDGKFALVGYEGGLPGNGWQRGDRQETAEGKTEGRITRFHADQWDAEIKDGVLTVFTSGGNPAGTLKKVDRKSPTLGAKPPQGAVVLFDGSSVDNFSDAVLTPDKLLTHECSSKQSFGDHSLHLEFRTPFRPLARGQARGNSGVYVQSRYEVQVLDSFGLEGADNECGGIYSITKPKVNMCSPPLTWQTYDIEYTAARYENDKKVKNARITVVHNGVKIIDDFELPKGTPGRLEEGPGSGPLVPARSREPGGLSQHLGGQEVTARGCRVDTAQAMRAPAAAVIHSRTLPATRPMSGAGVPLPGSHRLSLGPLQVLVEELERPLSIDRVGTDKPFDRAPVRDFQLCRISVAHLGELVRHHLVRCHAVKMSAFDHERSRRNQGRHLGIVERTAQIKFENLVLTGPHIAVVRARGRVLPHPLIEVGGANRQAVVLDQRRNAHGALAAVGQAIEGDSLRIDRGECREPIDDLLVLRNDHRKQGLLQGIGLPLQRSKAVSKNIRVLRGEGNEAAFRQFGREIMIGIRGFR